MTELALMRTATCLCGSIQKNSGVIFNSCSVFMSDQVTYTVSDLSLLRTYDDTSPESGSVLERSFCDRCGSPVRITRRPRSADFIFVPLGIIDGDKEDLKPNTEIFCIRRSGWLGDIGETDRFEKSPTKL